MPLQRVDMAAIDEIDACPSGLWSLKSMHAATDGIGNQLRTEADTECRRCVGKVLAQPRTFALQPFGPIVDRVRAAEQNARATGYFRQIAKIGTMNVQCYAVPGRPYAKFANFFGRMMLQDGQPAFHQLVGHMAPLPSSRVSWTSIVKFWRAGASQGLG